MRCGSFSAMGMAFPVELAPGLIVNIGVQSEVTIIGYLLSLE